MLCRSKPETEHNVIPYHFDAAVDIFFRSPQSLFIRCSNFHVNSTLGYGVMTTFVI